MEVAVEAAAAALPAEGAAESWLGLAGVRFSMPLRVAVEA